MAESLEIGAVLYQDEGGIWIAQVLEHDIVAQAESLLTLTDRLMTKIACEWAISMELKREPLEGIDKAPDIYWEMYDGSTHSLSREDLSFSINSTDVRITPRMRVCESMAA